MKQRVTIKSKPLKESQSKVCDRCSFLVIHLGVPVCVVYGSLDCNLLTGEMKKQTKEEKRISQQPKDRKRDEARDRHSDKKRMYKPMGFKGESRDTAILHVQNNLPLLLQKEPPSKAAAVGQEKEAGRKQRMDWTQGRKRKKEGRTKFVRDEIQLQSQFKGMDSSRIRTKTSLEHEQ